MSNSQGKVNTKLVVTIVAVIILLAGLYWVLVRDNSEDTEKSNSTSSSQSSKSNDLDYNGSLASLAAAGKARKCTMDYSSDSGGKGTGTSYTDGKGRSRLTIVTTSDEGNQGTIDTIVKDGKSYAWIVSGDTTFGYISDAKVPQSSDTTSQSATAPSGTVSPDQKFSMKCVSWTVDESQFAVPTNINFVTLPSSSSTTQP